MTRGDIFWVDLGEPVSSAPAKRRPVLVIQANGLNRSRLNTVVVVALTSNTERAAHPGNVFLPAIVSGLAEDSVVNVTQVATVDRQMLDPHAVGQVPDFMMAEVAQGLCQVLGL